MAFVNGKIRAGREDEARAQMARGSLNLEDLKIKSGRGRANHETAYYGSLLRKSTSVLLTTSGAYGD